MKPVNILIDEANKVIDIDINVLCANTWVAGKSGKLNILSLTSDGLQIALPNTDEYAYSVNYYSQRKAEADAKIPVSLICVDSSWGGTWELRSRICLRMRWQVSTHSLYEGSSNDVVVFTLDFPDLLTRYPNAFVRIDEMKCTAMLFSSMPIISSMEILRVKEPIVSSYSIFMV